MSAGVCEWEPFEGAYLEFAVILPICIMLQLVLLGNTLYYEYIHIQRKRKHSTNIKMKLRLRLTFILLQLSGIYFTIFDLFRFVIDPPTLLLRGTVFCDIAAYSPKLINIIYYGCYAYHILLRLQLSFEGSFLALSKKKIIFLSCITTIPCIVVPILILWLSPAPCIWTWIPMDINRELSFCAFRNYGVVNIVILFGIVYAVILNITFGIIFTVKLKQLLHFNDNVNVNASFKVKSLVIKNSILTLIGCVSTILNYVLWILISSKTGFGAFLLYTDVYLNCLVLAFMFKYNENYYKKFCRCCILICFMNVDKSYDKDNEQEFATQEQKIRNYLARKEVSSLFSRSNKTKSSNVQSSLPAPQSSQRNTDLALTKVVSVTAEADNDVYDFNKVHSQSAMTPPPMTPQASDVE